MDKQVLLSVRFQTQGKEKQKYILSMLIQTTRMCKCEVTRTLRYCIYYDSAGKRVGLEEWRLVLTLLASIYIFLSVKGVFRTHYTYMIRISKLLVQRQPSKCVLKKRCSENMQQTYRETPVPKRDFNKVTKQLYWNRTSAWVFSCKYTAYF